MTISVAYFEIHARELICKMTTSLTITSCSSTAFEIHIHMHCFHIHQSNLHIMAAWNRFEAHHTSLEFDVKDKIAILAVYLWGVESNKLFRWHPLGCASLKGLACDLHSLSIQCFWTNGNSWTWYPWKIGEIIPELCTHVCFWNNNTHPCMLVAAEDG